MWPGPRAAALRRGAMAMVMAIGVAGAVPAQWQQAKLTAADGAAADQFGFSVSLHGNTALVGSPFDDDAGTNSGSVYVMVRDAFGTWTLQGKLRAADGAGSDQFGMSVSLSGNTALVGGYGGAAYVFVRDGGGSWTQQAKLTASDATVADRLGFSVSLCGDTALVGSPYDDDAAVDSGAAYVFVRDGSGIWTQQAKLKAVGAAAYDSFGHSVSLRGDTALVGAFFSGYLGPTSGGAAGSAHVFVRDGGGNWTQQARLAHPNNSLNTYFGWSVSLDGDTALVGAWADENGGSTYVFVRDGSGVWTQQARLKAADVARFGYSVSLRGDTALVGAYRAYGGSACVFVRDGSGVWTQQARLKAAEAAENGEFGYSVSLSGDTALIGAPVDDVAGADSGSAYVMSLASKVTAPDAASYDFFGCSVSLDGDTALVGANGQDDSGPLSGSAYVLVRDGAGRWVQQAKLTASNVLALGDSVSLSGDTALVSAFFTDAGASGAYVFVRDGEGNWTQQTRLTAGSAILHGHSVSLSGDTALVGAVLGGAGAVYVFVRDGLGNWTRQARLTAADGADGDQFGISVSLSGDTALVGAELDDDAGSASGSAYVFVRDGFGNWTQQAKLTAADAAAFDQFGVSVSLSGDRVLVGSFRDDDVGAAYVFVRDGFGSWTQQAKLMASDATPGDQFGQSVSLSGDAALVGAPGDNDAGNRWGSAYRFLRDSAGLWSQSAKLTGDDDHRRAGFGASVSLDGPTALVGAPEANSGLTDGGAAFVFSVSPGSLLPFGAGCAGTAGVPTLSAQPGQVASIGESIWLEVSGMPGDIASIPFAIIGLSKTEWGELSLPLDMGQFGLSGCRLYVSIDAIGALVNDGGRAAWELRIPDRLALIGLTIYLQAAVVDFGANAANLIVTNAGALQIVDR